MAIEKVIIKNFKCFQDSFELNLNPGLNIVVGDNEARKSTILEAIHLALTGMYKGRNIQNALSQYLFNNKIVAKYIESVNAGTPEEPPSIVIELFFKDSINPVFEGNDNSLNRNKTEGFRLEIKYNEKYNDEYSELIKQKNIKSLPIEYYEAAWKTFARQTITTRSLPVKSAMIDSANYRYTNGSDIYISRIIKDFLSPKDITAIAQAHRNMKNAFISDEAVQEINRQIKNQTSLINGIISLSVDLGTKNAWANSLVTQLNDIPFNFIGQGEQCVIKTELALTNKQAQKAQIILLEEPESHLSFSKLNRLISAIEKRYCDKQIIVSTHSSFVANKLGLDNLLLLANHKISKIASLTAAPFFKKMAGYDTLRMLLCEKAILVEGASDELIVQKAYMQKHDGKLPIFDNIDVIAVGTSFLRFLEVADKLKLRVAVVTDNDGDIKALEKKYADYLGENQKPNIKICFDKIEDTGNLIVNNRHYNYNTLEPKIIKANDENIRLFENLFQKEFKNADELQKYMFHNKTECALAIFETTEKVKFPNYILEAIYDA